MRVVLGTGLQPNEAHYRLALESAGYSVVAGASGQQNQERSAVALVNPENAVAQLKEWR
jgi:hypothetical protein